MAGQWMLNVITDLNDRGVPTAENGKGWTKGTAVNMLRRKRYGEWGDSGKGIRVHNGAEYQAVWDAVFDRLTFEKLQAALKANEQLAARRGNPRKYPWVGFVVCGNCGAKLGGSMKRDRPHMPNQARYKCKIHDAFGKKTGCGGVTILAEPLEDLITEVLIYRLESADFAAIY